MDGYGWWFQPTPLKKYDVVNWDDNIPNRWKNKVHVPNHQPANMAEEANESELVHVYYCLLHVLLLFQDV